MKRLIMCEGPNELEIMRILLANDKLIFKEFEKTKSTVSPKDFAKKHIKIGKWQYDNGSSFYHQTAH